MDRDKLIREAFIDELNKTAGMATIGKVLSRVMGKGSKKWVKDSIAYGKRNTVSSKRIGKSGIVARGKKFLGKQKDKKLTKMQKRIGSMLYKGKQAVTQPLQFLKDDYTRNVKYFSRDMKKVKKGKYTTMFGNKRNVIGYSGNKALIERKVPAKVLGATVTVPGIAGLTYVGQQNKKQNKVKRGAKAGVEAVGWGVAPTAMLGGYVLGAAGKAVKDSRKKRT